MTKTSFRDRSSLLVALQDANDRVKEKLDKIEIALSESLYPLQKNSYHFVTRMLKSNNRVERALYSLIYVSAYKSEILSAGSSYVALHFALHFLDNLMKESEKTFLNNTNEYELLEEYDKTVLRFREVVRAHSTSPRLNILEKHIERVCEGDKYLSQAILQALEIAGLEGKIHVEDSKQTSYMVEMKAGYSFSLKAFKFFLNDAGFWEERNVKVMIVDGLLETVAELDKILNRSMETKIPLMIVANGFSEEVVATLKMNTDRGAFNIIPVRLGSDLDNLNVANDIAVVCGTDVISSLKGEMVLYTDYDALPVIDLIRCTEKEVMIEHGITKSSVSRHIRALLEKRGQNHVVEDISTLFDNRIKGLIANAVVLRLPDMPDSKKENVKMKIDVALRTCKTMLNYGIVETENLIKNFKPESKMDMIFLEALKLGIAKNIHQCSALSAYLGTSIVGKTMLSMVCARGFVENDAIMVEP